MKKIKSLSLIMIMTIMLTGCGKKNISNNSDKFDSPDKVVAHYCDILVKGNYGDILDIADMPESEFIADKTIEGAKSNFRERFMKKNNDAISCTYTVAAEDDEKVSYKLVINGNKTQTLDIKKSNNKAIIDNISTEAHVYSLPGSKVTMSGIDMSKYKVDDNDTYFGWFLEHYTITILSDDKSVVEASHPLLSNPQKATFDKVFRIVFPQEFTPDNHSRNGNYVTPIIEESVIKEEYYNEINNLAETVIFSIIKDTFENNDVSKYNQYFINNDNSSLSNLHFEGKKQTIENVNIHNITIKDEKRISLCISYNYYNDTNSKSSFFNIIKDGDGWKIEKVTDNILG